MHFIRLPGMGSFLRQALFCLIIWAIPAQAQSPYASRKAVDRLQSRADQLERELRDTTGRLETMGFELNQANEQLDEYAKTLQQYEQILQDMHKAFDTRLQAIEAPTASVNAPPPALDQENANVSAMLLPSAAPDLSPERLQLIMADKASYLLQEGKAYLSKNDFSGAETLMRSFIETYAEHQKIDEAQYVLGEALLLQEFYAEAAKAYIELLSKYQNSPNAPKGLVKLAKVMRLMNDSTQACVILEELPLRYPEATPQILNIASAERNWAKCT